MRMLGARLNAADYVARLNDEIARVDQDAMRKWADLTYAAWENEQFVYVFGNGGSGTTATHISEDLGKSSLREEDLSDESKSG
jgi:D-sedoheptulose 7-phosphate isomerase